MKTDWLSLADEARVRERRMRFPSMLLDQIRRRLPNNVEALQKTARLSDQNTSYVTTEPQIPLLEAIAVPPEETENNFKTSGAKITFTNSNKYKFTPSYKDACGENLVGRICHVVAGAVQLECRSREDVSVSLT